MRAVEADPRLRAAHLEVEARQSLVRQAGRFPNPVLDAEAENLAADGPEQTVVTVAAQQRIELGGDRRARQRVAAREAEFAALEATLAGVELTALVRIRYAEAAAAQTRQRLALAAVVLADSTLSATTEQVAAGDRSPVDQTRAEVALADAQVVAARAEALHLSTFARLAALWTGTPDFEAVAPLPTPTPVADFNELGDALDASTALALWDVETGRREATVRLEEARRIPDVSLSAGYRHFPETGARAAVAGLSIPLPIFDRNGGAVAAARARRRAADAEREAALAEARAMLAETHGHPRGRLR